MPRAQVIVGFTGTRQGMTMSQLKQFQMVCYGLKRINEFHFGGAIGADAQAVAFVESVRITVIVHPCPGVTATDETIDKWRWRPVLPPLVRNRNIVDACNILIAAPETDTEQLRSGTWATIRHARRAGKPIVMLSRGHA